MKLATNHPLTRSVVAATAMVAMIALSGCGSIRGDRVLVDEGGAVVQISPVDVTPVVAAGERRADTTDDAAPVVSVEAAASVPTAFQFRAELVDGGDLAGAELYDGTPTIVTFVQPTCPFSLEESPKLANAAERHPDVRFVVVHSGGDHAAYTDMIAASALRGTNVVHVDDTGLQLWDRFGIGASPSSILIDRTGLVRSSYGALGDSGLDRAAEAVDVGF